MARAWTGCLLGLALAADAWAIRPPETTHLGSEPVRVRSLTARGQAIATSSPVWQAFATGEGRGWQARFDEAARTPHRMWGPGLELGPTTTAHEVGRAVLEFVSRHPELLGTTATSPTLRSVREAPSMNAWYVDVDVPRDGLHTWRGGLTFRIKHGRLVMVGVDTYPNAPTTGSFVLAASEATLVAKAAGPAPGSAHTHNAVRPVLLPRLDGGKLELRRVYEVRSHTQVPIGHWVSFVDAETGELLNVHNEVRFFSGELSARHDDRLGNGGTTVSDLPYAQISTGGTTTYTTADGSFTLRDAANYTVSLNGERVRIIDQAGNESTTIPATDRTLTASDFSGGLAALTTYVYLHQVQDWALAHAPTVGFSDAKVNAYVNINDVCNAYFDGDVNFFQAGSGCNNTGRLADVIFHEWGHGFHTYSILSGYYDGSVGEGAADTMSFLMTDDSRIAPNFFTTGTALRNTDNTNRFPDDYVANDAYVHDNGLIFGGSMWDTREALRRTVGEPGATEVTSQIYVGLLKGGPEMQTAFDEAMFADDDDGNLGNGTPHLCELIEGFGLHGLGLAGDWAIDVRHDPLREVAPGEPVEVRATLASPAPACLDGSQPTSGTVHFRVDDGEWRTRTMAPDDTDVVAELPAGELGQLIEYYLEINGPGGARYLDPPGGIIRPYTAFVGGLLAVHCDDFETTDGGYTHELLSGELTDGADDWLWGVPKGKAGDPSRASSGGNLWGTDLGDEGWNGEYQNDKHTRLQTPTYDLGHYEGTLLRYERWLSIEDGYFDRATIFADDQIVWTNWGTDMRNGEDHHLDDAWATHLVPLGSAVTDGEVALAFELQSDAGLSFGGWNLDDVCIVAPATVDNKMGVSDLVAAPVDGQGAVSLSWTHPKHGPVVSVRVVRKASAWPTGYDDGSIVAEYSNVQPGKEVTLLDEDALGRPNLFYAVYGFDGEGWLSWTREGLNAAQTDAGTLPDGATAGDPSGLNILSETPPGCACSGAPTGAGWLTLLLGLLGLRRRR